MACLSRPFEPRADHRQGGAFAIRPLHMDHRGQLVLRIVQRLKQTPHAIQRQVDDFGVERHHPGKDDVGASARHVLAAGSGAP